MERMLTLLLLCPALFFTTVTSQQDNVCSKPNADETIAMSPIQKYYNPGEEITLSCIEGHTPVAGPRKVVCTVNGVWTRTKFLCLPKQCPYPDPLPDGELYYDTTYYESTINYTCNEGYVLIGSNTSVCQANGTWSTHVPECKPVTCDLAPVPQFGMIIYDTTVRGNTTNYGTTGKYICHPPRALIGNHRAECTANGTWTKTPECKVVTCRPPQNIARGYMSTTDRRDYDYKETVKYGCTGDFVLEGSQEIVCQQDGNWSEKPSCMAPCRVGINRGRILFKGRRYWIKDFTPNKVLHKEIVSVYCKNTARNCGYAVSTQCIDGRLQIPECYKEPSSTDYNLYPSSLPSEITQC